MGYILLVAFLVLAAAVYARSQQPGQRPAGSRRSLGWYVGVAMASWVGLMALGMAVFFFSHLLAGEDDPGLRGLEGEAIAWVAVRDLGDAEALWRAVHRDIGAETSRSAFMDCVDGAADRTTPDAESGAFVPGTFERAMEQAEMPSDNVLVRDGTTYSISDRRDDGGILAVDVRIEGPQAASITTVLFADSFEDPHWSDPRYTPDGWSDGGYGTVVGTVPEDPCFVGGEAAREKLQTTGTIALGHDYETELPELSGYRVLAVVRDATADDLDLVGGAFWWGGDQGTDGVHPPNKSGGETAREAPPDDEEPRKPPDWVTGAFLPSETVRLAPGTYTIEVWANPGELTPSAEPGVPAETNERNCTIQVEVTAGTHLDVYIDDIPTEGGDCPHEGEIRPFGF